MRLTFVVPGTPVGKGRPRATIGRKQNGRVGINMRTPEKTKSYEHLVQSCARNAMASGIDVLTGPLEVDISFAFKGDWLSHHTKKPDVDNCVKAVLDAMNGIVWIDDAQIVSLLARKEYLDDDRATISVTQL